MVSKAMIERFFQKRPLAVAGVSREPRKFGYIVFKDLQQKGYPIYPLNPNAGQIGGATCYASVRDVPEPVGGLIIVVPPEKAVQVIDEAIQAGVRHIWLQPGAESPQAMERCQAGGVEVIYDECVMMHAGPVKFPHSLHRWFNRASGKLPK